MLSADGEVGERVDVSDAVAAAPLAAYISSQPGDPVGDAPGNLGALAAELQAERAIIAADFLGEDSAVHGGEVLAQALRVVMKAISRMEELDEFIDGNAASFAEYHGPDGEQRLEWTQLHCQYVGLVEAAVREALEDLDCTDVELFEYARKFHDDGQHAEADRLTWKLLAMSDYSGFCRVMMEAHEHGPLGV